MADRRKFVRRFNLDGWPLRSQYGWYLLKKTGCVAGVLVLVLLVHGRMPQEWPWLSIAVPAVIAVGGFWLSGRIRIRNEAVEQRDT